MCFGAESATYRTEAYPPYHADRPPMPDDLPWQWERARGAVRGARLDVRSSEDLEADDLLGSFATAEEAAGGEALILTGDRDMFQCVDRARARADAGAAATARRDGHRRGRGASATASSRRRCRTSSPCAATRRTASPAPRASAPRAPPTFCAATARSRPRSPARSARSPPSARALIGQADELRMFRELATLRDRRPRPRPPDAPTDREGGSAAAAEARDGRARPSDSPPSAAATLTAPWTFGLATCRGASLPVLMSSWSRPPSLDRRSAPRRARGLRRRARERPDAAAAARRRSTRAGSSRFDPADQGLNGGWSQTATGARDWQDVDGPARLRSRTRSTRTSSARSAGTGCASPRPQTPAGFGWALHFEGARRVARVWLNGRDRQQLEPVPAVHAERPRPQAGRASSTSSWCACTTVATRSCARAGGTGAASSARSRSCRAARSTGRTSASSPTSTARRAPTAVRRDRAHRRLLHQPHAPTRLAAARAAAARPRRHGDRARPCACSNLKPGERRRVGFPAARQGHAARCGRRSTRTSTTRQVEVSPARSSSRLDRAPRRPALHPRRRRAASTSTATACSCAAPRSRRTCPAAARRCASEDIEQIVGDLKALGANVTRAQYPLNERLLEPLRRGGHPRLEPGARSTTRTSSSSARVGRQRAYAQGPRHRARTRATTRR